VVDDLLGGFTGEGKSRGDLLEPEANRRNCFPLLGDSDSILVWDDLCSFCRRELPMFHRFMSGMIGLGLLVGTGCAIPVSEYPIVAPSEAKPCPELYGAYRFESGKEKGEEDPDVVLWHLGPADENYPPGFLRIISINYKDGLLQSYNGITFVEKVGDAYIVHMPGIASGGQEFVSEASAWKPWKETWDPWRNGWDAERVKEYLLVRVTLEEKNLHLGILNSEFVISEIEAGELSGEVERSTDKPDSPPLSVRITAETPELRAFFERHAAGELFVRADELGHFVRLKSDGH